jgi:hypothetical protein
MPPVPQAVRVREMITATEVASHEFITHLLAAYSPFNFAGAAAGGAAYFHATVDIKARDIPLMPPVVKPGFRNEM